MYKKDSDVRALLYATTKKKLVEGAAPTTFAHQILVQINMDETKVLLTRHVSENKRNRDAEKDHQQLSCFSQ